MNQEERVNTPTESIMRLLKCAWEHSTTNSSRLSEILCLSSSTIDTYFERAAKILMVHDRDGIMIEAVKQRWLSNTVPLQHRLPRHRRKPIRRKNRISANIIVGKSKQ
jgi:hypothetical protein